MSRKIQKHLNHYRARAKNSKLENVLPVTIVILVIAIIGVRLIYTGLAATFASSHEAETGTVAGNAAITPGTNASNGNYVKFGCDISSILVNSCRPWAGAAVYGNPAATNTQKAQFNWLENQIGQNMDVYRQYNSCTLNSAGTGINCTGGGPPLAAGSDELTFAKRANTYVDINWKPYGSWGPAGGGNTMVNNEIKQAAANIKVIAPKKVFLTIWHEPQNDVTTADGCTGVGHGNAGTPSQYIDMWKNVENIFNAQGVTNVVWAADYFRQSQADFDCQVPQLWPGSGLIDWVLVDAYGTDNHPAWADATGGIYDTMMNLSNSNPGMGWASKPWGLGEFGTCGNTNASQQRQYYSDAKSAFDAGTYPKLKMYLVWDDKLGDASECLTNYDNNNVTDSVKQSNFNKLYNDLLH